MFPPAVRNISVGWITRFSRRSNFTNGGGNLWNNLFFFLCKKSITYVITREKSSRSRSSTTADFVIRWRDVVWDFWSRREFGSAEKYSTITRRKIYEFRDDDELWAGRRNYHRRQRYIRVGKKKPACVQYRWWMGRRNYIILWTTHVTYKRVVEPMSRARTQPARKFLYRRTAFLVYRICTDR